MMLAGAAPLTAQQTSSTAADNSAVVLIPGAMTGPGTMGPRGYRRLCTPRSVGLYEWQLRWISRIVRPIDPQRAALNDLQSASAKSLATMATACKGERPETMKAQLAMIDARLDAMSQAVKTLRPAFDAFYASLDDEQQRRLDVFGPGRHRWRW
jgi:LTXXQ motif family protein